MNCPPQKEDNTGTGWRGLVILLQKDCQKLKKTTMVLQGSMGLEEGWQWYQLLPGPGPPVKGLAGNAFLGTCDTIGAEGG